MKHLLLIINKVLTYLASAVFAIWAMVSFIVYLVKDIPFNWLPVWLFIAVSVLGIIIGI